MGYSLNIMISLVILMGTIVIIYLILEIKKLCGKPQDGSICSDVHDEKSSISLASSCMIDGSYGLENLDDQKDSLSSTLDMFGSDDYGGSDIQYAQLKIDHYKKTNIPDNVYVMEKSMITIGRREDNDIVIYDPIVSRCHCIITYSNGIYFIEDLDSKNGTFVDKKRVLQKGFLSSPCEIIIGNIQIGFKALDRCRT